MKEKIAIIGAGNMAMAIVEGLLSQSVVDLSQLVLTRKSLQKVHTFSGKRVVMIRDNKKAVASSDIIILAIKPQQMAEVLEEIKGEVGKKTHVVRVMPNLCAKIGESLSCWTKNKAVTKKEETLAKKILGAIGQEVFFGDEYMIDDMTAIFGSGPAYVFFLTEMLEDAAIKLGLTSILARKLAKQTVVGSALLLKSTSEHPASLRAAVTSYKGITHAAFEVFTKEKLTETFFKGIQAGKKRARELRLK